MVHTWTHLQFHHSGYHFPRKWAKKIEFPLTDNPVKIELLNPLYLLLGLWRKTIFIPNYIQWFLFYQSLIPLSWHFQLQWTRPHFELAILSSDIKFVLLRCWCRNLQHFEKFFIQIHSIIIQSSNFFFPLSQQGLEFPDCIPCRHCCRIHQLQLYRRVGPSSHNKCPGYDIKQPNGEAPVMLELWGNAEYPLHCHHSQVHSGSEW